MIKPIKNLGQNFLKNPKAAALMVESLEIKENEEIIEIGPGTGALTQLIVPKPKNHLFAIEYDPRLADSLKNNFAGNPNISVINANILDWLPGFAPSKPFKIIGSIPYYITSPILHAIIKVKQKPQVCVLLIQKEVAEKIHEKKPNASYLSVFIQTFFDVVFITKIPKTDFTPVPQVDSAIVKLTKKENISIGGEEIKKYEGFLHKAFSQPRKMLNKRFTKEELAKADIDGSLRPANLGVEEWVRVFRILN